MLFRRQSSGRPFCLKSSLHWWTDLQPYEARCIMFNRLVAVQVLLGILSLWHAEHTVMLSQYRSS